MDYGMDMTDEERRRLDEEGGMTSPTMTAPAPPSGGFGYQGTEFDADPANGTGTGGMAPVPPTGGGGPGAVPPPPPPPPPAPPNLGGLNAGGVGGYAANWMNNPNRYLSDFAQSQRAAGEGRIKAGEAEALRGNAEWAAQRGVVGSSYEGENRNDILAKTDQNRREDEARLMEAMTNYETLDRQAAGNYGLDVLKYGETAGLDRHKAALDAYNAGENTRQFDATRDISQQTVDLRAKELVANAALQGRSLDLQAARDQAARETTDKELGQRESEFSRSLSEQQAGRLQTLGVTQQQLDMEAQKIQDSARLEGRSLDIQQARDEAESGFRANQLVQQAQLEGRTLDLQQARDQANKELEQAKLQQEGQQFGQSMGQRESEFARSMGLDEQQFRAQQDQFAQTYSEQMAARMQQDTQFQATLQDSVAARAIDTGLRTRALEMQQQGMNMDQAFKQASLNQERELTQSAQSLQSQGMAREDAYKYAALNQDSRFRQNAVDLQQRGLTQADAFHQAEMAFQGQQLQEKQNEFQKEMDFRLAQATDDKQRFQITMALWEKYYGSPKQAGSTPPPPGGDPIGNPNGGAGGQPGEGGGIGGQFVWDPDSGQWVPR